MKKIRKGHYRYKGYIVINHGYYEPDKRTWWEAYDELEDCADYHAETKRDLKLLIDKGMK